MNLQQVKNGFNHVFWTTIQHSQFYKVLGLWYRGWGSLLMFHRVVPNTLRSALPGNRQLEVTSSFFEELIHFFLDRKYEFLSLDQVCEQLGRKKNENRFVSITFDDGYKDNLTVALPILKKYKIPFTVYLTTGFLDRTARIWWYALEEVLLKTEKVCFDFRGRLLNLNCKSLTDKAKAFDEIKTYIQLMTQEEIDVFFKVVGEPLGISIQSYCNKLMLNWDQVWELSLDPLVTLGAHSLTHAALTRLDPSQVRNEILDSKKKIESFIDKEVKHFAYPFGTPNEVSDREVALVKEFGFQSAVTTSYGNLFPEHAAYRHQLPRLDVQEEDGSFKKMELLLNGYPLARARQLRRVVLG